MKKQLFVILIPLYIFACPFDEADIEVTIVAHNSITNTLKERDFVKTLETIKANKKLYTYFEGLKKDTFYQPLIQATQTKDTNKINTLLQKILYLEIEELLDKVEQEFTNYQKSRLLIVKTKKHLNVLTQEKTALEYIKKILESIGNPGLMGVGHKNPNKELFLEYKKKLLEKIAMHSQASI